MSTPISESPMMTATQYAALKSFSNSATLEKVDLSHHKQKIGEFKVPSLEEACNLLKEINEISNKIEADYSIALNYPSQNRFSDVVPYNHNLYHTGTVGFYYNVSPIEINNERYLAAQGPLENQESVFWDVVLHSEAEVIVTVTDAKEGEKVKCAAWWSKNFPEGIEEGAEQTLYDKEDQKIIMRLFHVKKEKRLVVQLHYTGWPDMEAPNSDLLLKLVEAVNKNSSDQKKPIIVHCSAGCGRTGVFIAAHSLHQKEVDEVNIPEMIIDMRRQRIGMVQKPGQLQAIYNHIFKKAKDKESKSSSEKVDHQNLLKEFDSISLSSSTEELFELEL